MTIGLLVLVRGQLVELRRLLVFMVLARLILGSRSSGRIRGAFLFISTFLTLAATGCSSPPVAKETIDLQRAAEARQEKAALNAKLSSMAIRNSVNDQLLQTDYSIGSGDVLEISVFGVDELNTTARVSSKGRIMLPLVGELPVSGRSPREVEEMLGERLTEYMHDPDVSVFVAEYRSQQVAVTGSVNQPAMHTLTRPRTVLELVSMSGGLSPEAGKQIYVQTRIDDVSQRLIIDIDEVVTNPENHSFALLLGGGDSVFVPEAGVVFVEGAVDKPGSFPLKGGMGVMEAVTTAGGTTWDAREADVQVVTSDDSGKRVVVSVPLDKVRANEAPNYSLQDGDIVVVPSSAFKKGWASFWRGFQGVFGMGYSFNGP